MNECTSPVCCKCFCWIITVVVVVLLLLLLLLLLRRLDAKH